MWLAYYCGSERWNLFVGSSVLRKSSFLVFNLSCWHWNLVSLPYVGRLSDITVAHDAAISKVAPQIVTALWLLIIIILFLIVVIFGGSRESNAIACRIEMLIVIARPWPLLLWNYNIPNRRATFPRIEAFGQLTAWHCFRMPTLMLDLRIGLVFLHLFGRHALKTWFPRSWKKVIIVLCLHIKIGW